MSDFSEAEWESVALETLAQQEWLPLNGSASHRAPRTVASGTGPHGPLRRDFPTAEVAQRLCGFARPPWLGIGGHHSIRAR